MQILTCVRPWELMRSVAANLVTHKKPRPDASRRALQRRAAQGVLPQLPLPEAQRCVTRAAKSKRHHVFSHQPVRHLVDERGHQVLLHNEPIAQGQFGRVYVGLASDGSSAPQLRMFKKLRIMPAPMRHSVEPTTLEELATEIATATRAQSALAPAHVLVTRSRKARSKAYLEMPVMHGTLRHLLSAATAEQRPLLARAMLADGLAQLAEAHMRGVIHRDIKPDNLFFHDTGLILGDWGLACFTEDRLALRHAAGTPNYAAPEVIDGSVGPRGPAMDLWSLGMTVLQALLGREEPWRQAYLRAYDAARDRGKSRTQALDAALDSVAQAHQDYSAWYMQRDTPAPELAPELARFAAAFAQVEAPLRALLLQLMAPLPTQRGSAREHLDALQRTSQLALGAADSMTLQALYASQRGTREAVEKRQRLLQRQADPSHKS